MGERYPCEPVSPRDISIVMNIITFRVYPGLIPSSTVVKIISASGGCFRAGVLILAGSTGTGYTLRILGRTREREGDSQRRSVHCAFLTGVYAALIPVVRADKGEVLLPLVTRETTYGITPAETEQRTPRTISGNTYSRAVFRTSSEHQRHREGTSVLSVLADLKRFAHPAFQPPRPGRLPTPFVHHCFKE